jgi:hypothetical protein
VEVVVIALARHWRRAWPCVREYLIAWLILLGTALLYVEPRCALSLAAGLIIGYRIAKAPNHPSLFERFWPRRGEAADNGSR